MQCYRCGKAELVLSEISLYEAEVYILANIVLRHCLHCWLEQNHMNSGEYLTPEQVLSHVQQGLDITLLEPAQ